MTRLDTCVIADEFDRMCEPNEYVTCVCYDQKGEANVLEILKEIRVLIDDGRL